MLTYGRGKAEISAGGGTAAFSYNASDSGIDLALGDLRTSVAAVLDGHEIYVRTRNGRFDLHWIDPFGGEDDEVTGENRLVAPLPGTVVAVLSAQGAKVEKGDAILTLEVMKMEQTLRAPFAGTVKALNCNVGDIVAEGAELAEIEAG